MTVIQVEMQEDAMDDTQDTQVDETQAVETPEAEGSGPKQLRDALKRSQADAARYKTMAMETAYADLKLAPDAGLGKAIAKEYDGDPTTEALAAYALDEYGYTPPVGEVNPQAQAINEQQARIDQAGVGAGSVANPSLDDILAKAEAERDNATTMAIKGQRVAEMMNPALRR